MSGPSGGGVAGQGAATGRPWLRSCEAMEGEGGMKVGKKEVCWGKSHNAPGSCRFSKSRPSVATGRIECFPWMTRSSGRALLPPT